jgi:hypothetical protein
VGELKVSSNTTVVADVISGQPRPGIRPACVDEAAVPDERSILLEVSRRALRCETTTARRRPVHNAPNDRQRLRAPVQPDARPVK